MRPLREPPTAVHLLARLRDLLPSPEWALLPEVRSSVGAEAGLDVLRRADAIAVRTWGPSTEWRVKGYEVKRSRGDMLVELRHPEKAAPIALFCESWDLVVPAPWTSILLTLNELPECVGLVEVGTGGPEVIVARQRRKAEPPSQGFVKALLRVGAVLAERLERDDLVGGAPLVPIVRHIGRTVTLACGHSQLTPLLKRMPRALPCFCCLDGLPTDRDVVLAALADAGEEDLAAYLEAIDRRAGARVSEVSTIG